MKNKVLVVFRAYHRGGLSGGPINSINQLVSANDGFVENAIYYLFTERFFEFESPFNKDKIFYGSLNKALRSTDFHSIYFNSFFDPLLLFFLVRRILNKADTKVYISPRGELMSGAIANKAIIKKTYIKLFSLIAKNDTKINFVFTNSFEREEAVSFLKYPLNYIYLNNKPRIRSIYPYRKLYSDKSKVLKIIWFSRITPKKNLEFVFEVLKNCRRRIIIDVIGSCDEPIYMDELRTLAMQTPVNLTVSFLGYKDFSEIEILINNYDLFFFATRGENYGHAVVESMLFGIPCLISNSTPWQNLSDNGLGWNFSLSKKEKFIDIIENFEFRWNSINDEKKRKEFIKRYVLDEK